MPKLMVTNCIVGQRMTLKCSDCEQIFSPPPVPRGARPWTPDEATAKLAGEFREHVEKVHFSSRPDAVISDAIPAEETQ
jgi:hypothetical protein